MNKYKRCNKVFHIFCLTILMLAFIGYLAFAQEVKKEESPLVFSTWEGLEPDKCASIWLIHRFIDSNAVIRFFPKGEPVNEGILFDTPDAKFRRYAQKSTFESFVEQYKITDQKVLYIARIIHDIEINIWERKVLPETLNVQDFIAKIILEEKDEKEIIKKTSVFFDKLYKEIHIHTK